MFKTAIYCRLSREDIGAGENHLSDSIENQRLIINNYISCHKDVFEVVDTYIDDGISGMTYERNGFNRMMADIRCGNINAVIVKDLSRIGREQIETLKLVKREFVLHNVRFIAITDDYDSFNQSKNDGLSTSIKLLLNDYYCADISKKVRSAQRAKMLKGDFIGAFAPYGYLKADENKNKLIVDKTAAEVVKKIFMLYLLGMGKQEIAQRLNDEGIPNPTIYKCRIMGWGKRKNQTEYWTYSTINYILNNPVYMGKIVQHKTQVKAYNIHKREKVPPSEQYAVENIIEPIISKDVFEQVQNMLNHKRRKAKCQVDNKYTGFLFCKECGKKMHRYICKQNKNGTYYSAYRCGTYASLGKKGCTVHSVNEGIIDELVLRELNLFAEKNIDEQLCGKMKAINQDSNKNEFEAKIKNIQYEILICNEKHKTMLDYLANKTITAKEFEDFSAQNKMQIENAISKKTQLEKLYANEQLEISDCQKFINELILHKHFNSINRQLLVNFVDKIFISQVGSDIINMEIHFKFKKN